MKGGDAVGGDGEWPPSPPWSSCLTFGRPIKCSTPAQSHTDLACHLLALRACLGKISTRTVRLQVAKSHFASTSTSQNQWRQVGQLVTVNDRPDAVSLWLDLCMPTRGQRCTLLKINQFLLHNAFWNISWEKSLVAWMAKIPKQLYAHIRTRSKISALNWKSVRSELRVKTC